MRTPRTGPEPRPDANGSADIRRTFALSIATASGLGAAAFTGYHLLAQEPGRALASSSAILVAAALVVLLRRGGSYRAAFVIAALYATGMTLALLGSRAFPPGDFVWCFIVPLLIAYAGGRELSRWLLPLYVVAAAIVVLEPGFGHRALWAELELPVRFLGLLALISTAAYLYERTRGRARARLLAEVEERRAAEHELALANVRLAAAAEESARHADRAQAASAAKTLFLSHMSHDIRTPLTGVIGMTSLLETTELDERQRGYLKTLRLSGEALNELIGDILDLARIDAGKVELALEPVRPAQFLDDVCQVLATAAADRGLELQSELAETLPGELMADPGHLRQILLNLAGNALKFTERGRVTIRLALRPGGDPRWWRLEVEDTGVGIPPEQHQRIFESFAQVDLSTTRPHGGVGLGLAICSRLAALLGGEVGLESREGSGSRFWVDLPLVPADPARGLGAGRQAQVPALDPLRLLLVDDSDIVRQVVSALLRQGGHIVETASDGVVALERLARSRFDAVLMDVQMPNVDGLEATRRLRSGESGALEPRVPVVGITALADPETRQSCLDAGMDRVVTKPVRKDALARALAAALDPHRGRARPAPASVQDLHSGGG